MAWSSLRSLEAFLRLASFVTYSNNCLSRGFPSSSISPCLSRSFCSSRSSLPLPLKTGVSFNNIVQNSSLLQRYIDAILSLRKAVQRIPDCTDHLSYCLEAAACSEIPIGLQAGMVFGVLFIELALHRCLRYQSHQQ